MTSPGSGRPPRKGQPGRPQPNAPGPTEPREGFTALARVLRAHGLRGELRIRAFNPEIPNLQPGTVVHAGERRLTIRVMREAGDDWLLASDELESREEADDLRGLLLEVPDDTVAPEEGAHFLHELVGMTVVTDDGEELGVVREVLQPGANDVYVVEGDRGELLIPAIGEVVNDIDTAKRRISITPLPGLLNDSL